MTNARPSVFDALATDTRMDDPLDQRLTAELAERLASLPYVNPMQALLDDFRAARCDDDVRAWLAPGQSSSPPPLPPDAVEAVASIGHVFDQAWLDAVAKRNGVEKDAVVRRLAVLLPRLVKALTPRGAVPSERAVRIGLDGLRRKAAK
jgi:uncharacterized protein YidB (DUF937 family)